MSACLLVVAGLKREAALLAGRQLHIVISGGHRPTLDVRLASVEPGTISAVVSFGLAGALDPALPVGAVVVSDGVLSLPPLLPAQAGIQERQARSSEWIPVSAGMSGEGSALVDPGLADAFRSSLSLIGIAHVAGALLGVDAPLLTAAAKAEAHRRTGAVAVDMESHVAAGWAARHGKPFAALRVISDGAERDMPPIVGSVMRPDGGIDAARLATGLLRDPRQIPGLVRTGRDFGRASRVLRRVGSVLDDRSFGCSLGGGSGGLLGLYLR